MTGTYVARRHDTYLCWAPSVGESAADGSEFAALRSAGEWAEVYAQQCWDAGGRENLSPIEVHVRDPFGIVTKWVVELRETVDFIARKKP